MGLTFQQSRAVGRDLGASPVLPAVNRPQGLVQDPAELPIGQMSFEGPLHSTPSASSDLHQLSDMICRLGSQIGESIATKLLSSGVIGTNETNNSANQRQDNSCFNTAANESQRFNVIVKSEKEPVMFRGDNSDKYTVNEWVEMMKCYLKRHDYTVAMQTEEVMGKLMGKARDVVKIGLRSNPALSNACSPDIIYNMLIQYFSSTSSCLPLQDFYSTLPLQKENAVDYWIRLNKAADMAEDGLKRQGRYVEDIGGEIAKMFVKHCPDTELASVFKYKQIHEWSSKDIQERLDEHQRERVSNVKALTSKQYAAPLLCYDTHVEPHIYNNVSLSNDVLISQAGQPTAETLPCAPVVVQNQQVSVAPTTPAPQPRLPALQPVMQHSQSAQVQCQFQPSTAISQTRQPLSQPPEGAVLGEMMSMLRELLNKVQAGNQQSPARRGHARGRARSVIMNCRICNDNRHTTEAHCRSDRLCFTCFSPDHTRRFCPTKAVPADSMQGN